MPQKFRPYLCGGTGSHRDGNISIAALVVGGTSNLILCDGSSLTLTKGLKVEMKSGAVLNIYGQAGNTGRLIVTNRHKGAAGIGSGGSSSDGDAGMINIHGGNITATGNQYGAGIGGGDGSRADLCSREYISTMAEKQRLSKRMAEVQSGNSATTENHVLHHVFIEEHNDDESDDDDAGE